MKQMKKRKNAKMEKMKKWKQQEKRKKIKNEKNMKKRKKSGNMFNNEKMENENNMEKWKNKTEGNPSLLSAMARVAVSGPPPDTQRPSRVSLCQRSVIQCLTSEDV